MKLQRALCSLLVLHTLCAPLSAQASAPSLDDYPTVTSKWTSSTIDAVLQCEVPSSMQLTESEEAVYKVGFGEGYEYGYRKCMADIMELFSQQGFTPSSTPQDLTQYETDTFSILLPSSWTVATPSSYQHMDSLLRQYFEQTFESASQNNMEMVLAGLTPESESFQIKQVSDFSYHPSWATFTDDEIQSVEQLFSSFHEQFDQESTSAFDMKFHLLQCPQATFIIQTVALDFDSMDSYALSAFPLADTTDLHYDLSIEYLLDSPFTDEDIAQFEDMVRSIHFYE